jgi:hypothetical protein
MLMTLPDLIEAATLPPQAMGSDERLKVLLHMARHPMGETVEAVAQLLRTDNVTALTLLNGLLADRRIAVDRRVSPPTYYVPNARATLRSGGRA